MLLINTCIVILWVVAFAVWISYRNNYKMGHKESDKISHKEENMGQSIYRKIKGRLGVVVMHIATLENEVVKYMKEKGMPDDDFTFYDYGMDIIKRGGKYYFGIDEGGAGYQYVEY